MHIDQKRAGRLDKRAAFRQLLPRVDDGAGGNAARKWSTKFTRWAGLMVERGTEARDAGREQSSRMATLTVRSDKQTRTVTAEWSIEITFRGDTSAWNIRSVDGFDRRSGMITMTVESGVAV